MTLRNWEELETYLCPIAELDGEAFRASLADAPADVRELILSSEFGGWAAEAVAEIIDSPPQLAVPCVLGHYKVLRRLAGGGMGEVYEAHDERLRRNVAIKLLRAADTERLEGEARALAGLRHPHICRIFDIGRAEGVDYFVMELLDGAPLSDRLRKGPFSLAEILAIGRAVASALAEAHRAGFVHRDVKPSNILLTRNGPMLIDFGIADWVTAGRSVPAGTPPYMAPEQAQGICDARSDIYSVGRVLREMAGPQPPRAVDRIIESCLSPVPDERWQSAADLAQALEWIAEPLAAPAPRKGRTWYAVAGVLAIALLLVIVGRKDPPPPVVIPLRAADGALPAPQQVAISPDGTRVAFMALGEGGETLIWIRKLSERQPQALAATAGATRPFWSPDGRSIGMFKGRSLWILELATGSIRKLTDATGVPDSAGWGRGDYILFAAIEISQRGVIYGMAVSDRAPQPLTVLDAEQQESHHRQPVMLADGVHFLYLAASNRDEESGSRPGSTYLAARGSTARTLVLRRALAVGAVRDRVYYLKDGKLWSQRLNITSGMWADEPKLEVSGAAWATVASAGIAYLPVAEKSRPAWVDRHGRKVGDLPIPQGDTVGVAVSQKGDVLVTRREEQSASVGLWVVRGSDALRIGSAPGAYHFPVWSPDGEYIYYGRGKGLYRRSPKPGADEELVLPPGADDQVITTLSPNAAHAYGVAYRREQGYDIFRLDLRSRIRDFWSATRANETLPHVSPDGRWMAWLCDYLDPRGRLCVSPVGDPKTVTYAPALTPNEPQWSFDGKQLYFYSRGFVQSSRFTVEGGRPHLDRPEALFRIVAYPEIGSSYAVSPDPERFVVRELFNPPDPVLIWNPALGGSSAP